MSCNADGKHDAGQPPSELREVDDTYILNASTGLYEPKTYERQEQVERRLTGTVKKQPFFVHNPPAKITTVISALGLLVSVLTLFGLALTVYYTHKQWIEANRTASASEQEACAANRTARIANDTLTEMERSYVTDQRAWVSIDHFELHPVDNDPEAVKDTRTFFRNTGKTPAQSVELISGILVLTDPRMVAPNEDQARWMDLIIGKVRNGSIPSKVTIVGSERPQGGAGIGYDMWAQHAIKSDELAPLWALQQFQGFPIVNAPEKIETGTLAPLAVASVQAPWGGVWSAAKGNVVVLYGTVFYDDVFGKPRTTKFCSFDLVDVPHRFLEGAIVNGDKSGFSACAVHNEMK